MKEKNGWIVDDEFNWLKLIKLVVTVAVIVIILIIAWPFSVVGSTERAVIKTFGEVKSGVVLDPGLKFKIPFAQKIVTYDLTPIMISVNVPMGEKGAVSKDKQTIGVTGNVIWKYDEQRIYQLATQYSSLKALEDQVRSTVINAIKQTIGRYDIDQIVQDQQALSVAAKVRMASDFEFWPVVIDIVNLDNFDWSDDYDAMIKQTVAMRQNAVRAEAELSMIEQQAAQKIKKAEADALALAAEAEGKKRAAELNAEALRLTARGEADAKRIEGEGIAQYNNLIAQNLSVQIKLKELEIEKIKAEKWDGRQVPNYVPLSPSGGIVTLPSTK